MTGIVHEAVKAHGDKGTAAEWNANHKITGNVDCEQHQHLNHVLENRTDWPAGPVPGQIVFRSDFPNAFIWTGTMWASLTPVATIVVAADGTGNFTDLQDGIDALPAGGGAVYMKEGAYNINAQIVINKSNVSIFGSGRSTILRGANGIVLFYTDTKNYLSIRDLYFTNIGGQAPDEGIRLENSIGSFIESCWIDNMTGLGIGLVGTTTGTTIRNCHIQVTGAAIGLKGNDGVIESCYLDGGQYGIFADWGADRYRFIGNIIINSTIRGVWGAGFNDCSFTANYIGESTNDGVLLQNSNRNTFTGNNIVNNGGDGIEIVAGCDRNLIVANTIYNNAGLAINDNGTNTLADHNIVA